ncbi:hypothetical protein EON77_02975 [bacterium]|nr:MAG: hypothetical protein EON77_02975 [bacterium]
MRRVLLLTLALSAIIAAGCSSSSTGDDTAVKDGSGQTMNPSGKPAEADAARAAQMQSQGQQQAAAASADSKAMQEAMKRTGGK